VGNDDRCRSGGTATRMIRSDEYWQRRVEERRAGRSTAEFIDAFLSAKNAGAMRADLLLLTRSPLTALATT
jgi:hypothetical protein